MDTSKVQKANQKVREFFFGFGARLGNLQAIADGSLQVGQLTDGSFQAGQLRSGHSQRGQNSLLLHPLYQPYRQALDRLL